MPAVIAYGEDALTYWALTNRTPDILRQLQDESCTEDALAIYRPSFGRRGRVIGQTGYAAKSAQFGEFDAILATPVAVYPIESKWSGSSELRDGVVTLRAEQVLRHKILGWYLRTWSEDRPENWQAFLTSRGEAFPAKFPGNKMAPAGSTLACNLHYLLGTLAGYSRCVRDVLLYLAAEGAPTPCQVKPDGFALVTLGYQTLEGSSYFELATPSSGS